MSAAEKHEQLRSGDASSFGSQYRWSVSAPAVDIAMPAPPAMMTKSLAAAAAR
jgi:hypothetical protein